MIKKLFAVIISLLIINSCSFVFATPGYGDNNTGADNEINDTIKYLSSDVYDINGGFITGVDNGTTVSAFISKFHNYSGNVIVPDSKSTDWVFTGMVVRHSMSGEQCSIAVKGDVDKNGKVNTTDIIKISDHITSSAKFSSNTVQYKAADIDSNGKISVVDLVNVRKIILG